MKTYAFRVVVEPDEGGYHAYCPALRSYGAVTQGATEEEAHRNINEVVRMIVDELHEDGIPLPGASAADVEIFKESRVARRLGHSLRLRLSELLQPTDSPCGSRTVAAASADTNIQTGAASQCPFTGRTQPSADRGIPTAGPPYRCTRPLPPSFKSEFTSASVDLLKSP